MIRASGTDKLRGGFMPTKNLTIMFTDIKGFTARTSEETREGVVKLLAEHEQLLLPVIRYFDGHVVKTIGDAFLACFDSPTDAVLCGLTIQEVLRQHNAFVEEKNRLQVRVAINVGDVELKDGDVLGEPVNLAARLEAITDAGEVFFTEAVYLSMNRREVPSAEVGERTFKGIPYPVKVFKVVRDPSSEQVRRLAEAVRLTKDGPVIRGLRPSAPRARTGAAWLAAAGVAGVLIAAVAILVFRAPSEAEVALERARVLLSQSQNLSALEVADGPLSRDPTLVELRQVALRAADAHIEWLRTSQTVHAAFEWLQDQLRRRPYLEGLKTRLPALDAESTTLRICERGLHDEPFQRQVWDLVRRYPASPEVPYIARRVIEERAGRIRRFMFGLYEEALKRGGYRGDDHIWNQITMLLSEDEWNEAHYAYKIAKTWFPERVQPWAVQTLKEGSPKRPDERYEYLILNCWEILADLNDPLIEDPYYRSLRQVLKRERVESACRILLQVDDAARGRRAVAVVRETLEKGGLTEEDEKILQQTIEQLKARWGN